jgi:iron complex outermembrane receptor protein
VLLRAANIQTDETAGAAMTPSRIAAAIIAGAGAFAFGSLAGAQGAAPADDISEVVVTGSRIVRNGNNAPTPVTVANVEQLAVATPSNIPDALNKLPAFSGSRSTSTPGNGANPNQGNYLNLRGFGINRVLVLLDGHRAPSTHPAGDVNVDTLPQMLVQRVDVVTGGASAVYGSDAVTGVVNFILDKQYQGMKGVAQYGMSSRSDDESWRLGFAGGTALGDRGHVIFSAEHFDRKGIESKFDRPNGAAIYSLTGQGSATNPYRTVVNGRLSSTSFGGRIIAPPAAAGVLPAALVNQQFATGGVLVPFDLGTPTGSAGMSSGGDGGYVRGNVATAPLVSSQVFGRYQFEISDNFTAYAQGTWAQSQNSYHGQNESRPYNGANSINIYNGNAFLPANVQAAMGTTLQYFGLGRYNDDFGNLILLDAVNKSYNASLGIEGKFGDGWSWDAFFTHGVGKVRLDSIDNVNNPRFYAAIDAVRDSNNNIVCRVTLTNPGLYPGCVPMNILGNGSPSQASIDYITGDTWWDAQNTLDNAGVNLQGQLGRTWAGPISVATSLEFRKNSLEVTTSDDPNTPFNSTGLRGPFTVGTQNWTRNIVAPTKGSAKVSEVSGEAVIPLLTDKPFAKVFEFNGAARYTHYSNSGNVTTWKAGLNYQPVDDLRLRATRSRDIRAPSLLELYAGRTISITGFGDLHTGGSGFTNTLTQGNPNLVPEEADTTTIGIVWSPSQVPGLSVSVDYYDITIDNAIVGVGGNNNASQQACEVSGGTSPVCAFYIRPFPFSNTTAANYPTQIETRNLNIASNSTHGVDVELNYNTLGGRLDLRLLAAFQPSLLQRTFPTSAELNLAGAASQGPGSVAPQKQRYTLNATYSLDKLRLNTQLRYLAKLDLNADPTLVYADAPLPSITYVDLAMTYDAEWGGTSFTPFLSVNNVFDKDPPLYASSAFIGNPGFFYPAPTGYDLVGRYFTAGVRLKF